ncbi:hypothetical protein MKX01_004642 [Papaver californicum]|nr:hypothetical protein MKX01_004642 [Papaver californicum]
MEMEDEYGIADLRQMIAGRTSFPAMNQRQQSELVQFNRNLAATTGVMPARLGHEHYQEMLMLGGAGVHRHRVGVADHLHHNQNLCGGGGMMEFCSANDDSTTTTNSTTSNITINPNTSGVCVLEMMEGNVNGAVNNGVAGRGDNGGGNSRWPRQETLKLLEIRSSLDNKFKEANQKGPLWDEVARIMAEEHGYQRSGKKCREKFENLYKYYKKTKEGKSGRQDGKNYRFFRQLEALYGETTNSHQLSVSNTNFDGDNAGLSFQFMNNNSGSTHSNQEGLLSHSHQTKFSDQSLSLSNSSDFDTSSSENNNDEDLATFAFMENGEKKNKIVKDNRCLKRGKKNWKAKIRDFVDSRMKKLMDTQEAWLDKVLKTLEHKEQERILREEEWRGQETARLDQEHIFWAKERARFEARDAVIMEGLQRMVGNELKVSSPDQELIATNFHETTGNKNHDRTQAFRKMIVNSHNRWLEDEISNLTHLRNGMESRFHQCGYSEKSLWEDISSKMASLGYNRSAEICEEKWLRVNKYITKTNAESNSTYKESSRNEVPHFQHLDSIHNHDHQGAFPKQDTHEQGPETMGVQLNDVPSPSSSNVGMTTPVPDSYFRFMMTHNNQEDNLWQNYGVKLNSKGGNQISKFISPLEEI